jgi:hypothetical protein
MLGEDELFTLPCIEQILMVRYSLLNLTCKSLGWAVVTNVIASFQAVLGIAQPT